MLCHHCGNNMPLGQRVCPNCGATDDLTPPGGGPAVFTIVEQTEIDGPQREAWASPDQAAAWYPNSLPPVGPVPTPTPMSSKSSQLDPASRRIPITNRDRPLVSPTPFAIVACVAGLTTIAASMLRILTIRSDAAIPQYLGDYTVSDLDGVGTNFQIAFLIAGTMMLLGGLLVRQRAVERFGAGLAGGAGAVIVPMIAFAATGTDSLADRALQQAQYVSSIGDGGTTFDYTLHLGFFVLLVAAALGLVTLVISSRFGRDDARPPSSTWLCVAGSIGCVVAGAGQLVPGDGARFADNFSNPYSLGAFVVSRLAMIGAMVVVGSIGFLVANRYGLGLAVGALSIYTWQWASSLFEVGNLALPPAIFNPGGDGKPHIITTVGVVLALSSAATIAMLARRPEPD